MSFAMQSRHHLSYGVEESFGNLPVSPAFKNIRHTGCDLKLFRRVIDSDEIRSDRHFSHVLQAEQQVGGDLDFELSFGAYDDFLAAALMGSWQSNVLLTGSAETSFTLQQHFEDINLYQSYAACRINEWELVAQPGRMITGRFGVKGRSLKSETDSLDETIEAGASFAPMDSFQGSVREGGQVLAIAAGLDLKLENGVEPVFALGAENSLAMTTGRSRLSGELTAYFEDGVLLQKFLDKSASSLELTLSGEGGSYNIHLPNIIYTGADLPVRDEKEIILSLPFRALYDDTEGTNIKITRIAA